MVPQTATQGSVILALAFPLDFGHFHTPRSLTLMITVLVHHEVADYPTWKSVFDAALDWRHQHGERSCRIFHSAGNANDLILIFEWESLEQARAFMASDELKARMAKAGVKNQPRVDFMTERHTIRRSAAD